MISHIEYAKLTDTPVFFHRGDKGEKIIQENPKIFLDGYHQYHDIIIDKAKQNSERDNIRKEVFTSKKCHFCSGKMRYIIAYDFWGCSNYMDKTTQHSILSGEHPYLNEYDARVSVGWLSDIIQGLGYKSKVTAKKLFQFYENNGIEDLREKYGYGSSETRIEGYNKTRRRSQEQELCALKYLQNQFNKVVYQQCIAYKLSDKKESFCIPDFIASTPLFVKVIDAKLDYANDEKMKLYVELIRFILRDKNDMRPVTGAHIFYDGEPNPSNKFEHILLPKNFHFNKTK